jgi:hypothetical protein
LVDVHGEMEDNNGDRLDYSVGGRLNSLAVSLHYVTFCKYIHPKEIFFQSCKWSNTRCILTTCPPTVYENLAYMKNVVINSTDQGI